MAGCGDFCFDLGRKLDDCGILGSLCLAQNPTCQMSWFCQPCSSSSSPSGLLYLPVLLQDYVFFLFILKPDYVLFLFFLSFGTASSSCSSSSGPHLVAVVLHGCVFFLLFFSFMTACYSCFSSGPCLLPPLLQDHIFFLFFAQNYILYLLFFFRIASSSCSSSSGLHLLPVLLFQNHIFFLFFIQDYLCRRADKHMIPKVDNTNVDRSVATIHATVLACLRHTSQVSTSASPPPPRKKESQWALTSMPL